MRVLATFVFLLFAGCGASIDSHIPENVEQAVEPEFFEYSMSISPTPAENARERYRDFELHYRFLPEDEFGVVLPDRVESKQTNEVYAYFTVKVPVPYRGIVMESFYSYKFDGEVNEQRVMNTEF